MELSLPAKSQTLTLITCTHHLSSSKSLRRDFLGCGRNNLLRRPLGLAAASHHPLLLLRSRGSKCRKLRTQRNQQSRLRLLIIASFLNSSISLLVVVFAVTAVSALSVAYFSHCNNNKKKNNSKEVLSSRIRVVWSQFGRNVANHVMGRWFLGVGDIDRSNKDGEEGMGMHFQESILRHDGSIIGSGEFVVADSVASSVHSDLVLKESEPVLPPLSEAEMVQLAMGKSEEVSESGFDTQLSGLMVKAKSSTASVHLNPTSHECGERSDLPSPFGSFKQSVREDLYTFYAAGQSVVKSSPNLNGVKALSIHASHPTSDSFSSLRVNSALKGAKLSAKKSLLTTAENVDSEVILGHQKGGSSRKSKSLGRSKGSPRDNDRLPQVQEEHTKVPLLPNQNGRRANDKPHSSEHLNSYNHFLRSGRLGECVDLLEDMERRGLLDMNKVYHAKFFNICKSQKAVKEAFRFCKLVPNPTLSTFNMLMCVCASAQDSEGAFQVLQLAQGAGLKADCKLYTTLISTCAKSGKVDTMFEVFHEMVNAGVEPNVHTYGALIDGCARAGQVAKAFGAYGIMRSKNVKPDRVVFNALITACGQSGAVDRAFDVLAEMSAETKPIDPDHITLGALMKACANAGQVHRGKEVYKMVHKFNIKGTPELYTIAINSCSETGDWEFASNVYDDMTRNGIVPDEMFLSALIDVAGHAGKVDAAFEFLQEAKVKGTQLGIMPYSSLMGACCNAKNWKNALALHEDIKSVKLKPTVATMNALVTALCDGDQLPKAIEILSEMKDFGVCPNTITYSILLVASERKDDLDIGLMLLSEAKKDCVSPNLIMCKCIIGMCLRRFQKACGLGEPVLSFELGRPQIDNKWTSLALRTYRETISAGEIPTVEVVSQVLGCLQLPCDASLKSRLVENLGVTANSSNYSKLFSLVDGFGEYDLRAFSLIEEAAALGIVPCVSFKENPIIIDVKELQVHAAEVYLLTVLKGLKHRLAAGAKLPSINILLPIEKVQIMTPAGEKTINIAGRISQAVASLLRRLRLPYQGYESSGRIRISGISLRRWFQPKLASPFSGKPGELIPSLSRIRKGISHQQRNIRTINLSLE